MRWRGMVLAGAATAGLAGAATARAAFVTEGGPYKVGTDPLNLNEAAFNGDGRPAGAPGNGPSSALSVFLRQPGGGFAQEGAAIPTHPGAASGPSNAAVGDFDGNGRVGLGVAN